jgi:hypothetical protein
MTTDEPRHPVLDAVLPPPAEPPQRPRSALVRTRLAAALLVIACLLAIAGAVLPWLTTVTVRLTPSYRSEVAWHVWDTGCGLLFPLFAFPLFHLSRAGLDAIRGVPLKLRRRPALLLALAGCAGVVIFSVLTALGSFVATFAYWSHQSTSTDILFGSGCYVSLAGYALATIASLLLPATSRA